MQTRLQKIASGELTMKLLRDREKELRLDLHDRTSFGKREGAHRDLIALFKEIRAVEDELKRLERAPANLDINHQ